MKTDFEIPLDIKNDLIYCQRALTNHILLHQKMSTRASKPPEAKVYKSLKLLEKEIIDIGDEQRLLFNRLRFFMDYHQITNYIGYEERRRLTKMVADELANFSRTNAGEIRPIDVTSRLSEDALYAEYFGANDVADSEPYKDSSSGNSGDEMKTEQISGGSEDEPMEMPVHSEEVRYEQKVYAGPRQKILKPLIIKNGQSLLIPFNQRKLKQIEIDTQSIPVVRPEIGLKNIEKKVVEPQPQPAAISLGRMRLAEALSKAKNASKVQAAPVVPPVRVQVEAPKLLPPKVTAKIDTPLSSSHSSNASSEEVELKDEEDASQLGQEGFLRMFGLFTPAAAQYMMNRRPQRKRRMCTSTERGDFHYGKFELFEKQFANKRNNRQFLYSPPATRAKRRVGSIGPNPLAKEPAPKRSNGIKSNASSSSSLSSSGSNIVSDRVCLHCYKKNNLLQCQECCGKYHAGCHEINTLAVWRKSFCPLCVRQKVQGKFRYHTPKTH